MITRIKEQIKTLISFDVMLNTTTNYFMTTKREYISKAIVRHPKQLVVDG